MDAAAGLGYVLRGGRDGQTTDLSPQTNMQGVRPVQGDVRPQHPLAWHPRCGQRVASPLVGCASLAYLLGTSCPTRADASHSLTIPQMLEAISIAPRFVQTMLSAMRRAERWPTARLSHLRTADSILMFYQKERDALSIHVQGDMVRCNGFCPVATP
jgi:hypothetical protein